MQFISFGELAKMQFNIQDVTIRTPVYKENSTYHLSNAPRRKNTGLVYLKNCDMTTTSHHLNTQYKFKKGSLVLLPELLKYHSTFSNISKSPPSFYALNMHITSHDSKKLIIENEPFLIFENTPSNISEHIAQIPANMESSTLLKSHLYMLWHLIFENLQINEKTHRTMDYINITNKSNKELAEELNISVSTLTRMFKKYYNSTPASYALQSKIENAKFQLSNTNMAVGQIASNLGFNSPEHFSRIFKKHTGYSPIKYRNIHSV